jgi:UDP-N-acetylglucosamine diphosphorylase/glucosamine-1-phosphate N-acetyltransferase
MNLILMDNPEDRVKFFPLTLTRPISGLRVGAFTIAEKWARAMHMPASHITSSYLSKKFPFKPAKSNICINSRIFPNNDLQAEIHNLHENEGLFSEGRFIACKADHDVLEKDIIKADFSRIKIHNYTKELKKLNHITDIISYNSSEIVADINLVHDSKNSISDIHTICYNTDQIFIGEDTKIRSCILDAESGPIYIDNRVTINPGSVVVGPAAILHDSVISIGSKIRENTTIGPYCKVGGEISQVVFQGFSNKAHDGFLGSSVIGEWCNFGAGSNNSNLKNNYSAVKLWDYVSDKFIETGLQYCGLIMGDYSKCGINTMFNTGTVVGICANIFGIGYMPKFIPSFSWGNNDGFSDYKMEKALETIKTVMARRNQHFNCKEEDILRYIFTYTAKYRGRI